MSSYPDTTELHIMRVSRLALLAALLATPAWADAPMVVTWSTWLQSAPDKDSDVISELQAGQPVVSLGCANGWCQVVAVYAVGYVPERLLASHAPPPPTPVAGAACIPAEQFTHEGPLKLRVCPATAPNTPDVPEPRPVP